MTIKVKIQRVDDNVKIPVKATKGSAGFDITSTVSVVLTPKDRIIIPTGLKVSIPEGYECQVRPRSGLAAKNGISVLNSPGTIDSDYTGEIGVILVNHSEQPFSIEEGMRIAQIVFSEVPEVEFEEVDNLDATERNDGGFGSTGLKQC